MTSSSFAGVRHARIPWSQIDPIAAHPSVRRLESTWAPTGPPPLRVTSERTGIEAARRRPDLDIDGDGVVFGDVDAGFDIYHPHLFRADGGTYRWVDVDGDGEFDPGTDGVDINDNGTIGPDERLRILAGRTGDDASRDGQLRPSSDWVYVDANGDRRRNAGPGAGFHEDDPAYAEPTFVVDDVDGDGRLDPRERLVRLDTSKLQLVVRGDDAYRRGRNLADLERSPSDGRAFHGTGVASILVGGQPRFHDHVGLAPEAELVGYAIDEEATSEVGDFRLHRRYIEDAVERDVDVLLHEWSNLFATPQDGSSNLERTMDAARDDGVLQVAPLGNLNLSQKHVERPLEPASSTQLIFDVDDGYDAGNRRRPYRRVWGSLYWRSDQSLDVELAPPDGPKIDLATEEGDEKTVGQYRVAHSTSRSPRGTSHLLFAIWRERDDAELAEGGWTIRVTDVDREDELVGRIVDRHSSWSVGIRWREPTRDEGTAVFPATADSAVGVGAYGGRQNLPDDGPGGSEVGELRNYSGRGPRVDGSRLADLAAPDDPFAAASHASNGLFRRFGGTSGAAPHAAAALGLLKGRHRDWSPDRLERTIFEQARSDDLHPDLGAVPNRGWGWGKVDLYRALRRDAPPPGGSPPRAELDARVVEDQLELDAGASTDPDDDELSFRFDRDYDGSWETDWRNDPTFKSTLTDGPGESTARVDVRDPAGNVDGALAVYRREATGPPDDGETGRADVAPLDTTTEPPRSPPDREGCGNCSTSPARSPSSTLFLLLGFGTLLGAYRRFHPRRRPSR